MGLFDKFKKNKESETINKQSSIAVNADDFNPKNKDLNWFKSDQGLKSYEKYINFNAYVYETKCQAIQKTRRDSFRAAYGVDYTLDFVAENPIPYIYFKALVDAVRSEYMPQALYVADVREWLISLLETIAKPFRINEDGEPEVCAPMFDPPADLVSVDKNPLLKFVSKFDCFDLESSETGTMEIGRAHV